MIFESTDVIYFDLNCIFFYNFKIVIILSLFLGSHARGIAAIGTNHLAVGRDDDYDDDNVDDDDDVDNDDDDDVDDDNVDYDDVDNDDYDDVDDTHYYTRNNDMMMIFMTILMNVMMIKVIMMMMQVCTPERCFFSAWN